VAIRTKKCGKAFLHIHLELLKRKSFAINRKKSYLLQGFYSVSVSFYIVDLDKRDENLTKEIKARRSPWDAKRFVLQ
jgi:hypothetical protein